MTSRYRVFYQGRIIALGYVSPHPECDGHIVASVIPLSRKGKWENLDLEIRFESPQHNIFPETVSDSDAINEVLAQALIEPFKVTLQPMND